MIFIKGGTFDMGDTFGDGGDDEKPVHKVTVSDFYLGKYPVTVAQFKDFIEGSGYKTETEKEGWSWCWNGKKWQKMNGVTWHYDVKGMLHPYSEHNHPVIHVSWNDAKAFADWYSKIIGQKHRLPTEAEWEYAARGGILSKGFKFAGSNDLSEVAWNFENGNSNTHAVGQKNANELGLYDMSGNVWEWCKDRYNPEYYKISITANPAGAISGSDRVLRGGSWFDGAKHWREAWSPWSSRVDSSS